MLVIVESPSKAKTISKIVGSKYIVKASVGHIRQITQDKKSSDGRPLEINGIDIEKDFLPIFEVDDDKKKVVAELKKLAKESKDEILFATDEDREGEAISWHLAEVLKIDPTKVKRLVFHEITKKAILEAIEHPRNLDLNMVEAQKARQVLDKLVGYKLSPVLWSVMSNNHLSAGRVQSPALRLVCDREKEILAFVPEEYWEINGKFGDSLLELQKVTVNSDDEGKSALKKEIDSEGYLSLTLAGGKKLPKPIPDYQTALKLTQSLDTKREFTVIDVSQKEELSRTKPPFTTSTLQQAASSKLGLTPKQTMGVAQKLYEGIDINGEPTALITYMRTDSVNLSAESVAASREFISKKFPEFLPAQPKFYKSKSRNAQEAHEAIRPINPLLTPESLKGKVENNFYRLYDLIWKQMIACQMTDEIRNRFSFVLQNEVQDQFSGSVAWTIHPGFKAILSPDSITTTKKDIKIAKGQLLFLNKLASIQSFTNPPSRYSPASLVKKLEELGIGRPSTYASIISTIADRGYTEIKVNVIYPTSLGMKVSDLLTENFTEVTGSELTAKMEEDLDSISRGEKKYKQVLDDFWWDFKKEVELKGGTVKDNRDKYRSTETDVEDPKFGDKMLLKVGRFGEYYQNPNHLEIMYPKNFRELAVAEVEAHEKYDSQTEGKVCEACKKPLIVRVSKASLNPYIACPDYKVGNNHSVMPVNFGPCPECSTNGRDGVLVQKSYKGRKYIACNLDKKICGYVEKAKKEVE
ncbi:MAG: type I DNA topoisomerase [bacterium]